MPKITKLVLPAAGLGKRLLPLTKRMPKSLVKVCGRPLLEYVLEEAKESGSVEEVILIVNPKHRRYFSSYLKKAKQKFPFRFHTREQAIPGGNGHAIAQAYDLIKNEPFVVRFCDDIILGERPVTGSLISLYNAFRSPAVLLERVPKKLVSRFGVVDAKKSKIKNQRSKIADGNFYEIKNIVEKPKAKDAPSNLTIVGGYALTPGIIRNLKMIADTLPVIAEDALPLAVALEIEILMGRPVYGLEFTGRRLDCGTLEKLKEAEKILSRHL